MLRELCYEDAEFNQERRAGRWYVDAMGERKLLVFATSLRRELRSNCCDRCTRWTKNSWNLV
jgi:hypothetical protein